MNKSNVIKGKKSKQNVKNKNSAIKKIEPGNPKNTIQFIKAIKNNFGVKKFSPLNSVISRVLKRRLIASTIKKLFVDIIAWLISMQNPAYHKIV